jgi:hypothetical protein
LDGEVRHVYWVFGRRPRIGDVAVCGHVKVHPTRFPSEAAADASGMPLCSVCAARS